MEDLGAFRTVGRNLIVPDGPTEPVGVAEMTASGFRVARVSPLLGRPLVEEDERSVWAALLVARPTDAEQMIDRLRALDVVADVGGMGILLPEDRTERRRQVAELRRAPVEAVTAAPGIDDLVVQLAKIGRASWRERV